MAADNKAKARGPKLPVILTANNLLEGDVVFLGKDGWTPDPAEARIASDAETAELMEAEGRAAFSANLVVDPYLVPVRIDANGRPIATHFREDLRLKGPSIHPEIGKQAEFKAPA